MGWLYTGLEPVIFEFAHQCSVNAQLTEIATSSAFVMVMVMFGKP